MVNPFRRLDPSLMVVPLAARREAAAIREVMSWAKGPDVDDLRGLISSVFQQEASERQGAAGSFCGDRNGLAFLHLCHASVRHEVLILGISPDGIAWEGSERPVHVVLAGFWPPDQESERCSTIAEASRILRNRALVDRLLACRSGEEAADLLAGTAVRRLIAA